MTDFELVSHFRERERGWLDTLECLRSYHSVQMGKSVTATQWIAGAELGRYSWLGYFWTQEMFWFGFGVFESMWRPLIECDNRFKQSEIWRDLSNDLPADWVIVPGSGSAYSRLWAPIELAEHGERQLDWFKDRSRELHEYAVSR